MFLVTDKDNKTFGDMTWGENAINQTDNPNYYFRLYDSLDSALYLAPFFGFEECNIWEAELLDDFVDEKFAKKASKVKTNSQKNFSYPTVEKRILVAILCSLNLVKDKNYKEWCIDYLSGKDKSKERAFIVKESFNELEEESEFFSCAIPLLSLFSQPEEKSRLFTSCSIFRSISDSFGVEDPIDLEKIYKIASFVPPEEIASIM